ncbi:MAG: glycosyltransferase family 4 protein [Flavobacteriales bacterium]|nr:glycosyltransferase family 4 protein [Flavobacteriales bacterium]
MDKMLNIAHCVESYFPVTAGMSEVVRQLSERMVAAGHRVTVFTSHCAQRKESIIKGVHIRSYHVNSAADSGNSDDAAAYIGDVTHGNFDVVVLFGAQQWSADVLLPCLSEINAKKIFVPTGFSGLYLESYRSYFEQMPAWMRQMDLNIFHSSTYRDAKFAEEHGITSTAVIPNGAAEEEFDKPSSLHIRKQLGLPDDVRLILHVGSYTGMKGQSEAVAMFSKAKLKNAVLLMCGSKNLIIRKQIYKYPRLWPMWWRLFTNRIIMTQLDRASTVAAFQQADLFLFPSHIECSPIVLFEAMASGLPFLSSDVGNAAEIASWCPGSEIIPSESVVNGRTFPDVHKGAAMLSRMMQDPEALKKRMQQARALWKSDFSWSKIAQRYLEAYQKVCS